MTNHLNLPDSLQPFVAHGVKLIGSSGRQFQGNCPFCEEEDHFYINAVDGCWDCKLCGEEGNCVTFLDKIAKHHHAWTTARQWDRLSELRGIPSEAFMEWGLGYDGTYWLIPCRARSGLVHDIRRWHPRTGRLISTPKCHVQLFGADRLARAPRGSEVWLCEGEWDAIALRWLLDQAGQRKQVTVAVPGAGTFKEGWRGLFRGHNVTLCYDNDAAGERGRDKAILKLNGIVASLKSLSWSKNSPRGFDVRDMIKEMMI